MKVLLVEPGKVPYIIIVDGSLKSMQETVGGPIQAIYPFADPVAIVCHEEGKLLGLPLNRTLFDESGELYDIIAGTFFVCGLGEEDFVSLSPEMAEKYSRHFATPEVFVKVDGQVIVLPILP